MLIQEALKGLSYPGNRIYREDWFDEVNHKFPKMMYVGRISGLEYLAVFSVRCETIVEAGLTHRYFSTTISDLMADDWEIKFCKQYEDFVKDDKLCNEKKTM